MSQLWSASARRTYLCESGRCAPSDMGTRGVRLALYLFPIIPIVPDFPGRPSPLDSQGCDACRDYCSPSV